MESFIANQVDECLRTKAAKAALNHIKQHIHADTVIGIGTGATAEVFVQLLAESQLSFAYCVSSSDRSSNAIQSAGLKELPLAQCEHVDFYVDGIDEGLSDGTTIKGGGAALAREKVIATMAGCFITISDEGRLVETLGKFPLPIEVLPAAKMPAILALKALGGEPVQRANCVTDNGNIILDVSGLDMTHSSQLETALNSIPGVIENGIFSHQKANFMAFSNSLGVHWIASK
ncbi:ribose-5-phosphate isomerase RpiA [Vibrio sp. LaRot3]|uniref:ribose-5-phosphate isomerase RpiA n=1 Tax=Vibrio sp. LaRot3 TaxID=2998829 RepID=UPI0022CDD423|nr:ribose-5-phosphate isomerase RpiA [Vibrio sp. LaRot3]MDA0150493.1 ribose-5-phosphate isomerase RpiA [Vibrio sp. LaRot3]